MVSKRVVQILVEYFLGFLQPTMKLGQDYVVTRFCDSVHRRGGIPACLAAGIWGVVSQHALQVSRPTPREKLRGIWPGGSPGPHPGRFCRPTHVGSMPACTVANPLPRPTLLLWAVHILLEYILVVFIFMCFGWYLHFSCNQ